MYATTHSPMRHTDYFEGPLTKSTCPGKHDGFNSCSPDNCPVVNQLGTAKTFKSGETLFWEDDIADSYFLIESGVARGCRILSDGRRQICRFIFPGDLIAHSDRDTYPYIAEAITPVTARQIPRHQLDQAEHDTECVRKLVMNSVLAELHESQDQILVLGRMTALERVAHFLCALAKRSGANVREPVILPMSRVDIADYLGLTLETVSRVMSRLKREGKIKMISANRISVPNASTLVETCNRSAA